MAAFCRSAEPVEARLRWTDPSFGKHQSYRCCADGRRLRAAMPETSESIERDELDGLFARLFADRPQDALCPGRVRRQRQHRADGAAGRMDRPANRAGNRASRPIPRCLHRPHRRSSPAARVGRRGAGRRPPGLRARAAPRHPRVGGRQTQHRPAGRRPRRALPPDGRLRARPRYRPRSSPRTPRTTRPRRCSCGSRAAAASTGSAPWRRSLLCRMANRCSSPARCSTCRRRGCRRSLRRRGIGWIEDPSNASPVFERVRLRAARAALDSLGLTPGMLSLSARRLRQARSALDRWVADVLDPAAGMVEVHACGFFSIDRSRLGALPDEIVARVLDPRHRRGRRSRRAGAARRCGGDPGRPVLQRSGTPSAAWTLARARLAATPEAPARSSASPAAMPCPSSCSHRAKPPSGMAASASQRDRRSTTPSRCARSASMALRELRSRIDVPAGLPVGSLRAVASFWRGEQLLAVPPLGFRASADLGDLAATFLPLASPSGARR